MSRARNIKPGFFKNELLAECEPLARILFEGLWCEADREGRLEDRPRRLKVEYLPYDDCSVDDLLSQLSERGFIARYQAAGNDYIQVLAFSKHQNPHVRESESKIPAPCKPGAKHGLGNVKAQPRSPDSPSLIPDSPSLIPKSAAAPAADFKADLFKRWKALENGGGGAFLNKMFRDYKPDQFVLESVERTLDHGPADPKAFLIGILKGGVEKGEDWVPHMGMTMSELMRAPASDFAEGQQ